MMKKHKLILIIVALMVIIAGVVIFSPQMTNNSSEPKKFFCTDSDRTATCNDVGDKVCGWFNKSVQCLRYPCAINFDLRCEACKNPDVEYYTFGSCPTN